MTGIRIMPDNKMSTYEHMINALLYPVGTRGYGTDTGVPVIPEYSTVVCLNDKRVPKVVYSCRSVQMYMYMYMYMYVLRILRVQGHVNDR